MPADLIKRTISAHRSILAWMAVAFLATLVPVILGAPGGARQADSEWYRFLAEGHPEKVIQPFASRELEPHLVRVLDQIAGTNPVLGFALLSTLSVACCIGLCAYYLHQSKISFRWLIAAVLLPTWTSLFHAYLLPDIFYSALLFAFCLCLWRRRYVMAVSILVPLYATRECTALIIVCFCIAAIGFVRTRVIALALFFGATGFALEQWLASGTQGNRHQMSPLAYLLGKVPYNLAKNIFGVPFWSNTLPVCTPTAIYQVPIWLRFGSLNTLGPCHWNAYFPTTTLLLWLGTFGILPLVLVMRIRRNGRRVLDDVFLRFCVLYGVTSFLIGPLLGASVHRLVAYGWPAFALALPALWPDLFKKRLSLLILQMVASWACWLAFWHLNEPNWLALAVVIAVTSWLGAFLIAKEHSKPVDLYARQALPLAP